MSDQTKPATGTIKVAIKSRGPNAAVIHEAEIDTSIPKHLQIREAALDAINKYISLRGASLPGVDLSGVNFRGICLRDANFREANLSNANLNWCDLSNVNFYKANLTEASLVDANLTDAYLLEAKLTRANLTEACLRNADLARAILIKTKLLNANLSEASFLNTNLRGTNLSAANLTPIRDDFWAVLFSAPHEIAALREALINGKIDGSAYTGDCACLVGTIANARGVDYDDLGNLKPDSERPSERFFLGISEGDTPETNQFSKLAVDWIDDFLAKIKGAA